MSSIHSGPPTWRSPTAGDDPGVTPWFADSVCVFWLGPQAYAVQSALVGEVFLVDAWVPVPAAPAPVLGLFNLRGTPVALVDLAGALELPVTAATAADDEQARLALVLRTPAMTVGAHIRKMEMVVPAKRALYIAPDGAADEHPVVAGFLELPGRPELTITLLDPEELTARLMRLRYRNSEEDDA